MRDLNPKVATDIWGMFGFNPLNAKFKPTCHLLALLGAHHILHISRIRVKSLFLYLLILSAVFHTFLWIKT